MNRKWFLAASLAAALITGGFAYTRLTAPMSSAEDAVAEIVSPTARGEESEEAKIRKTLLGVWQDDYKGRRTMTLNDDGTGTMLVELSGFQATLFAPKLRFDMRWSLNGKTFHKTTVGGEPADKVNLILNTMGNSAEDTILEWGDDRLLLLDKDGKTRYDWRRVDADRPSDG